MAAKRLGLKTAGREAAALVQRFSDSLLGDEVDAFERIDVTLARRLVTARAAVRKAITDDDDVSHVKSNATVVAAVVAQHTDAVRVSRGHVDRLGRIAVEKAMASIEKELRLCERTMSPKFSGTAKAAVEWAEQIAPLHHDRHMGLYDEASLGSVVGFETEVRRQMGLATDRDSLERRLFHPTPAGLRGFGGRGIWWRTGSDLKSSARTLAIGLASDVRVEAMYWFNTEADLRG